MLSTIRIKMKYLYPRQLCFSHHTGCSQLQDGGQRRQIKDVLYSPALPDQPHDGRGDNGHHMVYTESHRQCLGHLPRVQCHGTHHERMDHIELLKQDTEDIGREHQPGLPAAGRESSTSQLPRQQAHSSE